MTLCLRHGQLVEQRPWSDDELATAVRLRRELVSASEIGRRLKRSRNSVIGALHRAKEPGQLVNQNGIGSGRWTFADKPARAIPLTFREQRDGR